MINRSPLLILGIIAVAIYIRLSAYGDLRLSVANPDTDSYVASSRVDLFSWDAFTSYRPFTTNLVYRAFTPQDDYRYQALAGAAYGTVRRKIDRGFSEIAVLQSVISIIGWACLAWFFSSHLKSRIVQSLSAGVIMLFAFTPQVADWDSVMSPESFSISFFVFSLGILIWLSFTYHDRQAVNVGTMIAFAAFFILLFLWVFVRDVNTYSLAILALFIFGLYVFPRFRKARFPLAAGLIVMLLFVLGTFSARQRPLWQLALTHVWESNILPVPANVDYFVQRGMPPYDSPEYTEWFNRHAPGAYMKFLLAHPVYTASAFFKDLDRAFSENMQPYFRANDLTARPLLVMIGNYLHPQSGTVFFLVAILLLIVWAHAAVQNDNTAHPWAWLLTWAFLTASATMFFSIFGDTHGLVRHALSSTVTYRLLMWLLLFLIADFSLVRGQQQADQK
jgi:hypothetical protein